jgi:hypothetical protein
MIIGVIARDGILLASDTRCMITDRGVFLGYHDQARKIAISSNETTSSPIACALACSVSGLCLTEDTQGWLCDHRYRVDTSVELVHGDFEKKYKVISKYDPSVRITSITSIFAKYEDDTPCLSLGNLSDTVGTKARSGVFSYPEITGKSIETQIPTKEQAIQFAREKILQEARVNIAVGKVIDIVYVTLNGVKWLQGNDRVVLPAIKKNLYIEYKKNPAVITLLKERPLLERWFEMDLY